ncbi:hypothetical protein [Candidatus Erwinia dacicola]|uniref:Uncharacterized protein n=1 Tax=Candidatus Erwinia dacicola TaxID=252393 RepID=A0A328TRW5_9GAMM|nr:hypothetical protein ACZ87_00131 [Candidatus Erwinia dacicola]
MSEQVKRGHEQAADLKASCGAVDVRTVAQLISDLATQLDVQLARSNTLAAENAGLKNAITAVSKTLEECEINGDELKYVVEPSEFDALTDLLDETPATDAFLAEVRASAIPEGYVLVPQQIFLDPSDIESICSQCGDGHESWYGDFTDGLLWVGNIQRDDGSIVHGMHISSADYSEEGGVTVCEFAAQLRQEAAQ